MSTATLDSARSSGAPIRAQKCRLRTHEQDFVLDRLQGLLERRDAVDAGRLVPPPEEPWLVHALDAAIVSYYRLAGALGMAADADEFLQGYRGLGLGSAR
jgi:hypothetical protein